MVLVHFLDLKGILFIHCLPTILNCGHRTELISLLGEARERGKEIIRATLNGGVKCFMSFYIVMSELQVQVKVD